MRYLLFAVLISATAWEDPWGPDAALAVQTDPIDYNHPKGIVKKTGVLLIRFHQEIISPVDGPRSHYVPSSSQYTKQAICKYGFLKGVMMGCDRLMRENGDPWVYPTVVSEDGRTLKADSP